MTMKIAIFNPKSDFSSAQLKKLNSLGEVVYLETREELPLQKLLNTAKGADIIGVDPDPLGGFEKAKPILTKIMDSLPNLKGVCLDTTSFGWVDLEYCKKRNLPISDCPGWSREAVAEHVLALLLSLAKRILVTDRRTQKGQYKLEMGFELKGKTLGIVGLGNIGKRVADLARGIGMKVIAYNRSRVSHSGVVMKSLDAVLKDSDAITLHITHEQVNNNFIEKEKLQKMKKGVIVVNLTDRSIVDEKAMAAALKTGKVFGYSFEYETLEGSPLNGLENSVGLKPFGWYTKEALSNLFDIFVGNIESMIKNKLQNRVV